jgi:Na+-driven multidrug efflux pump
LPVFFAAYPKALEVISGGASEEISKILKTLVPIMSAGVVLDAMRFNMLQQSRALNDFFVTSIIAFLGMSSGIALAAILGFETPMDINGVGMGYTFGIGITTGALFLRWKTKVAELVVVDAENNTSLESEPSVKHSLWNSFSSFFYFGRNDLVVQAKADTIEAHSLFEPP